MPVGALVGTFAGGDRTGFILFPVGRHESREDRKKPLRPVNWLRFPSWCSIRLFTATERCGTSHKTACPEERRSGTFADVGARLRRFIEDARLRFVGPVRTTVRPARGSIRGGPV